MLIRMEQEIYLDTLYHQEIIVYYRTYKEDTIHGIITKLIQLPIWLRMLCCLIGKYIL